MLHKEVKEWRAFRVEEEKLLPYEKCLEYGASSLDNAELLAAIIRTGTNGLSSIQLAEKLLENAGNLNGLYGMSVSELMQIKGKERGKNSGYDGIWYPHGRGCTSDERDY